MQSLQRNGATFRYGVRRNVWCVVDRHLLKENSRTSFTPVLNKLHLPYYRAHNGDQKQTYACSYDDQSYFSFWFSCHKHHKCTLALHDFGGDDTSHKPLQLCYKRDTSNQIYLFFFSAKAFHCASVLNGFSAWSDYRRFFHRFHMVMGPKDELFWHADQGHTSTSISCRIGSKEILLTVWCDASACVYKELLRKTVDKNLWLTSGK